MHTVHTVPQLDLDSSTAKVVALESQQAARAVEHVNLRRQLHVARQAVDPHIIQVRLCRCPIQTQTRCLADTLGPDAL